MDSSTVKTYDSELTVKGFMDLFEDLLKDPRWEGNYFRSYCEAEEKHFKEFKKSKYKNYDSFRHARRHYIFETLRR